MNNNNNTMPEEWEFKFLGLILRIKSPSRNGIIILAMLLTFFIIWLKL